MYGIRFWEGGRVTGYFCGEDSDSFHVTVDACNAAPLYRLQAEMIAERMRVSSLHPEVFALRKEQTT